MRGSRYRWERISRGQARAAEGLTLADGRVFGHPHPHLAWNLLERRCHDPLLAASLEEVLDGSRSPFVPPRGSWRAGGFLLVPAPVKWRRYRARPSLPAADPAHAGIVRWPKRPISAPKTGGFAPGCTLRRGPACVTGVSTMFFATGIPMSSVTTEPYPGAHAHARHDPGLHFAARDRGAGSLRAVPPANVRSDLPDRIQPLHLHSRHRHEHSARIGQRRPLHQLHTVTNNNACAAPSRACRRDSEQ